jgi:multidrug efflux pump subunit AcrA (membrane-fusion protein)
LEVYPVLSFKGLSFKGLSARFLLSIGTGALSLALTSCTGAPSASMAMPPSAVKLQTVQMQTVDEMSNYMGTMKSRKSAILQPRVSGNIGKILVSAGQYVTKGTPLVEIDPEKQQASVLSFDAANRSSASDRLSAEQTLRSLQATLSSKEANAKFLEQQVKRYSYLSAQGAVAKETADNYVMQHKAAEGDMKAVEAQIEAQKAAIAKMDNMVNQTAASAHEQKVQLQYYTIAAPFNGTVGDIPFKLGEYVDSTTKITTVTENRPLEVYISVPAEKAVALKQGMLVRIMDNSGAPIGEAAVFFISPVAEDTQTVLVKALFPNSDGRLRSNQTVTARVIWERHQGIAVPTYAVAHVSGQDFVFVANGNGATMVAKQIPVTVGDIEGGSYIVKSGLQAGDRVITSGVQNLMDGAPIAPQFAPQS